ncbi:MAG: site-specific integrase [Lentisphaerota bacterium]
MVFYEEGEWQAVFRKFAVLTLQEAYLKVQETLQALNNGLNPKLEKLKKLNALAIADTQLITFREITQKYFTFANLKDDRCSKLLVKNYLYPLNGLTLQQINKPTIMNILCPILASGKKSTYNRTKAVLSAIINFGIKKLDIDAKNHCHILSKAKVDPNDRVLSQTEVDKYLLTAMQWSKNYNDSRFGVFFLLLYYTGTRSGELKKLKWTDISESGTNNAFMTVQSENSKSGYKVTKPIIPNVLFRLKLLKDKCNKDNPYVFHGRHKQYLQDFRKPWRRFLIAADLPFDITPHCLKHTFATRLMDAGEPLKVIASFTGNRDFSTLYKYYLTVSTKSQNKALHSLNEYDKQDRPQEVQRIFDTNNELDTIHQEIIRNTKSMVEMLTQKSQGGEIFPPFE